MSPVFIIRKVRAFGLYFALVRRISTNKLFLSYKDVKYE